tara:strand:+ start:747 stop:1427 length:681 start_codon:yes stop_codon:yes gene_type:complete
MNVKNVFFDLDHTLWDFERNSALTFELLFKKYKMDVDLNSFLSFYVPINLKYWRLYRNESISKEYLRFNRLYDVFKELNINISDDIINKISFDYIENLPKFNHLIDGALEILLYLKKKYRLFLITNGFREVQSSKLKNSGIDNFFISIYDSESVGVKKPNPLIFNHALDDSGCIAKESVMIGDSLEADIQGSLAVGMNAIHYLNFGEKKHKECIIVNNLLSIKKIL